MVWVESPPLVPLAPATTSEEAASVFYPPVLVLAPRRSFLANLRRIARGSVVLAVAIFAIVSRIAGFFHVCFARIGSAAIRQATNLWRRFDPSKVVTVITSFGRWLRKIIVVTGWITAAVVPCLAIYAVVTTMAQTPPKPPAASQALAAAAVAAPLSTESNAPARTLANIRIVNAPHVSPVCHEQTWPYVTRRCLPARNGKISLTTDPDANASRNAMANASTKADDAGKAAGQKVDKALGGPRVVNDGISQQERSVN